MIRASGQLIAGAAIGVPLRRARRSIGRWGTTARTILGAALVADVAFGHWTRGFHPGAWLLGLIGLPAVLVAVQWPRAHRRLAPLRATGPAGHILNAVLFLALYLTPWYLPAAAITSDAALIFYGASMLLAAARGYGGCEVFALSNSLLGRDDQVGCILFAPLDHVERERAARARDATDAVRNRVDVPAPSD